MSHGIISASRAFDAANFGTEAAPAQPAADAASVSGRQRVGNTVLAMAALLGAVSLAQVMRKEAAINFVVERCDGPAALCRQALAKARDASTLFTVSYGDVYEMVKQARQ